MKLPRKQRWLKLRSQALERRVKVVEATQEVEQRLLERFLKKKYSEAAEKGSPSSISNDLYTVLLLWTAVSAQEHKRLFSSVFHIWKSFRDCKYSGILWQRTTPETLLGNWCLHPALCSYLTSRESSEEKEKGSTGTRFSITEAISNFFL